MDLSASLNLRADGRLESKAFVNYANNQLYLVNDVPITAFQTIVNGNVSYNAPPGSVTPWSHSISTPSAGVPNVCYRGRVTASATGPDGYATASVGSIQICIQPKPQCPGDPSCPPLGEYCLPEDVTCQLSPLVLNLANGRYDLSGSDDPVSFDLDADGSLDRITWTARANPSMAFLVLDRNMNGKIDDGGELFGDHTPLRGGRMAANGFDALAQYDLNGDGLIDAQDSVWPRLALWVDADHDGMSAPSELTMLARTDVVSLEVQYRRTNRTDDDGNAFRFAAKLHRLGMGERPYYDVYFHRVE